MNSSGLLKGSQDLQLSAAPVGLCGKVHQKYHADHSLRADGEEYIY